VYVRLNYNSYPSLSLTSLILVYFILSEYTFEAHNLAEPLCNLVDTDEVITITDAAWGKNVKRCLKIRYV